MSACRSCPGAAGCSQEELERSICQLMQSLARAADLEPSLQLEPEELQAQLREELARLCTL